MTQDATRPQTTSSLLAETDQDVPSAASAGEAEVSADGGAGALVPVTAWTSPEDCESLARGLPAKASPAEWAFARLSRMIEDFEGQLDKEHEIGCTFVGTPGDGTVKIKDLGYWAPDLLLFYGTGENGKPLRLIQHHTQLNVLLTALPKELPQEPPRRIGFALRERMEKVAPAVTPPVPAAKAASRGAAKAAKTPKR